MNKIMSIDYSFHLLQLRLKNSINKSIFSYYFLCFSIAEKALRGLIFFSQLIHVSTIYIIIYIVFSRNYNKIIHLYLRWVCKNCFSINLMMHTCKEIAPTKFPIRGYYTYVLHLVAFSYTFLILIYIGT